MKKIHLFEKNPKKYIPLFHSYSCFNPTFCLVPSRKVDISSEFYLV